MARRFALWPDSVLSGQSVRSADSNFVTCSMSHWLGLADHKLVRVSLRLANRPSLAGYWKLYTSILEIGDFLEWLETLIQRVLGGGQLPGVSSGDPLSIGLGTSPSNTADSSN